MKVKKLLTIMALLLGVCGGAWADTYEWTYNGVFTTLSVTASKNGSDVSKYSSYAITYYAADGKKYTCSTAVKMESATTLTFTTTKKANITIGIALKNSITYAANKATVKLDGTETASAITQQTTGATTEDAVSVTVNNVDAGSHTVSRGAQELGVFYIKVEEVNDSKPAISGQPASASYATSVEATALSVTATASSGGGDLSYQWKSCTAVDKTGTTNIDGATSAFYTPSTASAGTFYYFCTVTDANGSTDSNVATITVTTPTAPGISVNNTTVTTPRGKAVTLTATATGSPAPTVTWYQSETATNTGGTEKGTGATYSPDVTTEGTFYYYAVANNGVNPNATSEVVTLAVTNPDKTIEGNNFYIAEKDLAIPEQNIICDDITMQYSIGSYSEATKDETVKDLVSSFKASVNCSTNDWGVTFTPSKAGCLKVGVVINKEKKFSITNVTGFSYQTKNPDGSGTINSNEWTPTEKKYAVITIDVQAGSSYKFSVSGSKMGFYGFEFTPSSEQPSPSTWKDIAIDLRSGQLGTEGSNLQKYVTVGDTYSYADEAPESYNALISAASYNGSQHGYVDLKAKVPVESGIYKITLGTCQYGSGTGFVKNVDESSTLSVVDANGQTVTSFSQNNGTCYDGNTTENVISVWYTATSDETITVVCGSYTPYFAIEKVDAVPDLMYVLTYVNDTEGTTGTAPSTKYVNGGESMTIPANRTLYKEGYTLTGWNDGTTTHAIGSSFTPTGNTTLTAVFTANDYSLDESQMELTVRWDFQRQNGAPTVGWQNRTDDILVAQATVNGKSIDVKMGVNTNNGKFANGNWTDWAQVNEGTTFIFPSKNGSTVRAYSMNEPKNNSNEKSTLDDNEYSAFNSNVATYSTTETSGSSTLTIKGGAYYRYIEVTYPVTIETSVYTNTWQFGKSNGAPEFALQKSPEYTYEVDGRSLVINTDAGKLNNASRTDQWSQCNDGTLFKVPAYEGAKLSWNSYNTGNAVGFNIGNTLYNSYYVATADETVNMTATGIGYLSYIKIEPITLYEISGTISGGTVDGASLILTSTGNGQPYTTTIEAGAFSMKVPAGMYSLDLSDDAAYVISSPSELNISASGSVGTLTVEAVQPQTVSGLIANAPTENFTLTFTGGSHNKQVELAANATSFETTLDPDTYVISSSVGTLSPLSIESFKVKRTATSHNIYFPETIPAATQQNITVDNTATVAANVYNTVSDALAAAKAGNISSPVITLTSGQTYREQVIVDMANVTLKTSGEEKATITWYYGIGYTYYSLGTDGYFNKDRAMTRNSINMNDPARWGAAVLVKSTGNGFKAENIVFENSFNQYYTTEEVTDGVRPNGVQSITYDRTLTSGQSGYKAADTKAVTERAAALGFENNLAGCELTNCVLRGSQDTFYTSGKIYVKKSNIIGNTDYIFGGGDVVFDDCDLTIGGYSDQETGAHITASNGGTYIFRDCTVKKSNRTYASANLGRDWGGTNANVYYFNLKNEIGNKLSCTWSNMGGAVSAGTANLHIYDFDPTVNAKYSSTGTSGANVNGLVSDADALSLYAGVVARLGFTPTHIYDGELELGESNVYNICRIAANDNVERNVTLTRTLPANKWATIVMPFGLNSDQIASTFGEGTKVAQLTGADETKLTFQSVTNMTANEPYMIYSPTGLTEAKTISGVTVAKGTPEKTTASGVDFIGSYGALTNIPASDNTETYFFVSNNNLYKTAASGNANTIKGFRAYFKVPGTTAARLTGFVIDDETTGVQELKNSRIEEFKSYYNLKGQRVSQPKKGVYVVGGKKVVVK